MFPNTTPPCGGDDSVGSRAWAISTYSWIFGYSSTYWLSTLVAFVFMLIDAVCAAGFANMVKPMIDGTFNGVAPVSAVHVAAMIVGVLALRSAAGYVGETRMAYVGRMTVRDVRDDVFLAQLGASEVGDSQESVGDRVANIAYAVEQVAFSVTDAAKVIVLDGLTAAFCIMLMFYLSPVLASTMVFVIPVMAFVAVSSGRYVRRLSVVYQKHVSEANTSIVESWSNSRYIKAFRAFDAVRTNFNRCSSNIADVGMRLSTVSAAASASTQLAGGLALALLVLVASGSLFSGQYGVSSGTFFAVVTAMGIAVPSLRRLSSVYSSIQRALVSADTLRGALAVSEQGGVWQLRPGKDGVDLEFVDVGLVYRGSRRALDGVSLTCRAGELTLIVGESGSGKSSLLALIPRFHSPTEGRVLVDGKALDGFEQGAIYGAVSWVGTSAGVMTGTVRQNIAFGELASADTEDVIRVARKARAWEFIAQLPEGLDTQLGVGLDLSEGQKQRILIARAMLKRARIVLLDEATSALDRVTEQDVGRGILDAFRQATVVMATHRLDLASSADQIVVMERGRIVEVGKHDDLLKRRSAYWRLFSRSSHSSDRQSADTLVW